MQAVILAAGKGTRLAPITNSRSKGMLPILGKPILERVLDGMIASGLKYFILVVNPVDHELKEYFRRKSNLEVNIHFIDQDSQLGTAHALKLAASLINEEFVLSACDNLVPLREMKKFISNWSQNPNLEGLLSLERIPLKDSVKTGIVTLEGDQITEIIEKPLPDEAPSNISSTPLYIYTPRILDYLPMVPLSHRGEYELQNAIQMMIKDGHKVRGLFLQKRLTLTTAEDLLSINLRFFNRRPEFIKNEALQIGQGTKLVPPIYIEVGVEIGFDCQIGPSVYIEKNAHIGDSVQLENAVVLQGSKITGGVLLKNQVIS